MWKVILVGGTMAMLVDLGLDARVMMKLVNGRAWYTIATVMGLSILVPQVVAWCFLTVNGKASWSGLLRMLLLSSVGVAVLAYLWHAGVHEPTLVRDAAISLIPAPIETIAQLCRGLVAGRELEEAIWTSIAEGLVEAPASAILTLYPALLISSLESGTGADPIFIVSFLFSLAMITRTSTKLHFYGMHPSNVEYAHVFLLQKLPQTISQVLGYRFFRLLHAVHPREGGGAPAESSVARVYRDGAGDGAEPGSSLHHQPSDVDVEQASVKRGALIRNLPSVGLEGKGGGSNKWSGVAECGGLLYFCPRCASKILVLDPKTSTVSFVALQGKGGGGGKWSGVAECGILLYFCPFDAFEILVLDAVERMHHACALLPHHKWTALP